MPRIEVESVTGRRRTNEGQPIQRGANHRDFAREAGAKALDIRPQHGSWTRLFRNGKRNTAGWGSRKARLKSLDDENQRLKKLLAEAMLDNGALKDGLGKKGQ
jgi:putative transposase